MRKTPVLLLLLACVVCAPAVAQSSVGSTANGQADLKPQLYVQGGLKGKVIALAFSANGQYLAGKTPDSILVWEIKSGLELGRFESGEVIDCLLTTSEGSTALALSSDARLLAFWDGNGAVVVWNVAKGSISQRLRLEGKAVSSLAFSPDDELLAGSSGDTVQVWKVNSGRRMISLKGHTGEIQSVAFSPNGRLLASGDEQGSTLWDIRTGRKQKTFNWPAAGGSGALLFDSGGRLLSLEWGGAVLFDVQRAKKQSLLWFEAVGGTAAISPDGKLLALGHPWGSFVALLDWRKQECVRAFDATVNAITALAFTPDGKSMFAGYQRGDVKQIDLTSGRVLRALNIFPSAELRRIGVPVSDETFALVLSPDGKYLFAAASIYKKSWDVESGKEFPLYWHGLCDKCVTFSPDGKLVAATQINGVYPAGISLCDLATGNYLATYEGHQDTVNALAFSDDGMWLASGSDDKTVRIWDVKQEQSVHILKHLAPVWSVAFSHDRKLLATGDEDGKIRLWNAALGQELLVINSHGGKVEALTFSPDGRQLAALGSGQIKFWNIADGTEDKLTKVPTWVAASRPFHLINLNGKLVRPVFSGQVIKLIDLNTSEELASLLSLGDKDWMVITPDGSFDTSRVYSSFGSWKHLLWRFNADTFDYAPVEAFFSEFYRPGLLKEVLRGGRPKPPRALQSLDRRPPEIKLALATPPPPQDHKPPAETNRQLISCPTMPFLKDVVLSSRVQQLEVKVTKALTGNLPGDIRDIRLFRNDSLVKVWHGQTTDEVARLPGCHLLAATRTVICQTAVPIVAGANYFRAYAFNQDNVKSNDTELLLQGADTLARSDATLYILAIGIDHYDDASHNLRYAVDDAETIGTQLTAQQARTKQYAKTEVIKLLNEDATKENILLVLRRFAAGDDLPLPSGGSPELRKIMRLRPEDALLIYFAGHGMSDGQRFYLIPHDGFPAAQSTDGSGERAGLQARSISDRELEAALEPVDAGKMLMVIDACDSGQALESEEHRRGPLNSQGLAQLAYEKGFYMLTAAQSNQAALEASKLGHGLLTYALLEAFTLGDTDGDGMITEREWFDYAAEQVPRLQLEAMKRRSAENRQQTGRTKGAEIVFVTGDDANLPPEQRELQTPRSFYRTEEAARSFIVAIVGPSKEGAQ